MAHGVIIVYMSVPGFSPNIPPQPGNQTIPANRLYGGLPAQAPGPAPTAPNPNYWFPAPADPNDPYPAPNQDPFAPYVAIAQVPHVPHPANHDNEQHGGGHETHRLRHTAINIGFIALSTAAAMKFGDHHNPKHYAEVVGATFAGSLITSVIGGFSFRQWRQGRHERRINNNQTDGDHAAIQAANIQALIVRAGNAIGLPLAYSGDPDDPDLDVGGYDPTSFTYVDKTPYAVPPSPFVTPVLTQKPGFNPGQFDKSVREHGPLRVPRRRRTH